MWQAHSATEGQSRQTPIWVLMASMTEYPRLTTIRWSHGMFEVIASLGVFQYPMQGHQSRWIHTLSIRATLTIVFVTCLCPAFYRNHRHLSSSPPVSITKNKNGKLALPWIFYHRFFAGFFNPNPKPGAPWCLSRGRM